ncbi:UDP-4-amino-4,6-dideoxy-N-acetyl-beta-L-altrosamine transaminase [Halobacillus salinarum]|uniref:UDP-4-amino-4, 6-dideoxy-N-acetyl-beta-L-altrosamine transaminase n=1 Tax=Halobacillus salinarum TaxID=2932257 RepID=A0ABY4EI53_9BACI|nr:UDP-4-amino-4,6-dideoxy-N-acetyl-beta-L-altrosamine transaminase [Halobacillus salinarum]UOQ44122.1 UDP-4-amino-4,6-dideoxy-N-acetyl-beta-L-altrosamine transaminase [Halobacillus salinarum]
MKSSDKLALFGGPAVRSTYIPYGRQWIDDTDIEAVIEVLKSDYLTTGPKIEQFEQAIAHFVGAKFAVAFSSGTAALHAACFAAGINEESQVITSPMTFAASANCVLYMGGTPVFADIDPHTYNISPASVREKLTSKTKAIIPVDFTGQPAAYKEIREIAKENNLVVIEDAAHAIGAKYKGAPVGSFNDMTMFSFHPVKHITTGEGGMITTNNESYYQKLVQFRSHGITRDSAKLSIKDEPYYYEMQHLGFNYRLTDLQAALGLSQLQKLDHFIKKRKHIVSLYNESFKDHPALIPPFQAKEAESSWHLYIIRLNLNRLTTSRKEIVAALHGENIGVNVHYIPVHQHPYYQNKGFRTGECPEAEKLYQEIISLPLFPKMTEQDAQDVIHAVKKVLAYYASAHS